MTANQKIHIDPTYWAALCALADRRLDCGPDFSLFFRRLIEDRSHPDRFEEFVNSGVGQYLFDLNMKWCFTYPLDGMAKYLDHPYYIIREIVSLRFRHGC